MLFRSILATLVPGLEIIYCDGIETNWSSSLPPHISSATNVAGYISWGFHSSLGSDYAVTTNQNAVRWKGNSAWWIIETVESNNGKRVSDSGNFLQWFSASAFGGTNYSNTPVGAVSYVDEPNTAGINNPEIYFGLWAAGKNFAICAWNSRGETVLLQVNGDPFVNR